MNFDDTILLVTIGLIHPLFRLNLTATIFVLAVSKLKFMELGLTLKIALIKC